MAVEMRGAAAAVALGGGGGTGGRGGEARPQRRLDADLDADDRFDAGGLAGLVEAHGAVEAVVVGDRQCRHAEVGSPGHDLVDAAGAVAEREVGVHVEVDEAHAGRLPGGARAAGTAARAFFARNGVGGEKRARGRASR